MPAPDISQFELVDPAPAGQLIPAPAAVGPAAGQSLSGLSAGRRPEFDVMRGFVVAGLVVFHSAVAFASGASWFVTDPRPGRGFTVFLLWGSLWGMPLLFLISGMGARYAMRTRSAAAFARARLARPLVPFAFGLVLLFRRCSISKGSAGKAPSSSYTGATPAAAPRWPAPSPRRAGTP